MTDIDWNSIYENEIDAELCHGYYDGRRIDSVFPGSNRHPAYIHGFLNGRDDIGIKHGETAQERREKLKYIEAVFK